MVGVLGDSVLWVSVGMAEGGCLQDRGILRWMLLMTWHVGALSVPFMGCPVTMSW
ncbi:hypothetical protein COLO4_22787 [Corchorus olitorius]|uniref:Uncharacterized protein n=1 Tax=Corchorus olitorius TaxID=93759 RepID=A0A1R3IJX9_9ROSI|nr:hypothetical protein COLO4_22787 [Corchorus olitorius]